ncbi:hypothetical protein [Pseudoalteromonas galatheae]|uniref:hypothetical protein n=2 Tax=Pseudoalteromonas TaxID=53246 RepID=UPI0011087DBB|nr:hypothetical protein [Pseudoalteromonas galatheae]NKC17283.1 hypothetical protein [Pseudoalteromonas galatheae]
MKLSWCFLIFGIVSAVLFSATYINLEIYANGSILISILILSFLGKGLENIKHITVLLFLMMAIEYLAVMYFLSLNSNGLQAFYVNNLIFGTHLILDVTTLVLLKHRLRWSLRYIRLTNPDNWRAIYMTHADPLLYAIFYGFIIVDLAALGENVISNLEFLGIDESSAKQFWSWGLIYHNYEILKSILLSCVVTTLLATIFVERQRPDTPDEELESES